jgi:thiamine transport system permease protein
MNQRLGLRQVVLALVVGGAFVAPMIMILRAGAHIPTQEQVAFAMSILAATARQAMLSTLLALLCALPIVWSVYRRPDQTATAAWLAVTVPFVVPTPVAATMVYAVCAPQQWCLRIFDVDTIQGLAVVVIVHAWFNTGIIVRIVGDAWQALHQRYAVVSATLGMSPWQTFWRVTVPLLAPAIGSAVLLVFLYCVGSFGVVLLLGGGRVPSLEVEIWKQTTQFLRLDVATGLASVQIILTVAVMMISDRLQRRTPLEVVRHSASLPRTVSYTVAGIVNMLTVVLFVVPMVSVIWRSLLPGQPWQAFVLLASDVRGSGLFVSPLAAVWRSLWLAVLVAVLTTVLAWLASQSARLWRIVVTLPLGVSAVTLGLGYLLWFSQLGMLLSPVVVLAAHVVLALPLVGRQIFLAVDRLPPQYEAVAATLGAPPWRRWRDIVWPMLRRSFIAATLLGFAISLGDFAASLLLTRPDTPTAPVFIARLLSRPGATNMAMAAALSVVLLVVCVAAMALVWRINQQQRVTSTQE